MKRARRHIGYFLLLKQVDDKVYYLRWSYEDKPVIDTLSTEILKDMEPYRQYCNGNGPFPCLFRAKVIRLWRNTTPRRYDIALKVLVPDMITKVVNSVLAKYVKPEDIDSIVKHLSTHKEVAGS